MKGELWLRLSNYCFDDLVPTQLRHRVAELFGGKDASTKAFAAKIAGKHGWSIPFALRAIEEYKKFVYLGVTSKYVVTPPAGLDVVWHEHILFTAGYRLFCENVLREPFDHRPELLPLKDQTGVFNAQYLKILDFYRFEFNMEPPGDIWGEPKFDNETAEAGHRPARKPDFRARQESPDAGTPLYTIVDVPSSHVQPDVESFAGFGEGESGGGGATGSWGDSGGGDSGSSGGCSSGGGGCGGGGCGSS